MTAISARLAKAAAGRWFYTGMAVLIALIVLAGFGPSYTSSLAPPGLPFWVHLHGAAMTGWIVLFVVQTWLVNQRNLSLHRRLGWLSIGLVVVMVLLGVATDVLAVRRGATPPFFTPAQMVFADLIDLMLFASLYTAAILLRRQGEWHKRLLLSATVLLSWPALGRLRPLSAFGMTNIIPISIGLLIALALVGPVYDLIARRRIHPAYLWAVGLIILAQPLYMLVAAAPPLQAWANGLKP